MHMLHHYHYRNYLVVSQKSGPCHMSVGQRAHSPGGSPVTLVRAQSVLGIDRRRYRSTDAPNQTYLAPTILHWFWSFISSCHFWTVVDISIMCSGRGRPELWRLFMVVTVRTVIQESPETGSNPHATFNKGRATPFCSGMTVSITSFPRSKTPGHAGSAHVSFLIFSIFS